MSSSSGNHNGHNMPEKTEAARVIAKLLAKRRTSITEIPHLIESVERALSCLHSGTAAEAANVEDSEEERRVGPARAALKRQTLKRNTAPRRAAIKNDDSVSMATEPAEAAPEIDDEIKPTQPILVRRAEVVHAEPEPVAPPVLAPVQGAVRGVVQWFDTRTGRGTLRLQGLSSDLPVDAESLAGFGLTRLFKGQEIEAQLDGDEHAPRLTSLRLLNHGPATPISGGIVRDRHAKQVVVELKRQALSRAAARAEAEQLLSRRAR